LKKSIIIVFAIILMILISIFIGIKLNNNNYENNENATTDLYLVEPYENNKIIPITEVASIEEKTTPNTLIIYKTYYTKCKHFIKKYETIDVSKINLNEEEFKEKYKNWKMDKFSSEEIELSKEVEKYCGEHYKIKLEENNVIIYKVDENGKEKEYEKTNISKEYLTNEDIARLTSGIKIKWRIKTSFYFLSFSIISFNFNVSFFK